VIPVLVAEKNQSGEFTKFDFGNALKTLPNLPHARKSRANVKVAELR
jgi:hypothetical protein